MQIFLYEVYTQPQSKVFNDIVRSSASGELRLLRKGRTGLKIFCYRHNLIAFKGLPVASDVHFRIIIHRLEATWNILVEIQSLEILIYTKTMQF